ncbi:ankyrin repeat domain-containing protein [Candidatus Dependentiae bacterium]|nr:ankyrin repeat domain-containing protein [Candidatus Dependentiae bacterium]
MNKKLRALLLFILSTFIAQSSVYGMQQEKEDLLSPFFNDHCPSLSTLVLEKISSAESSDEAIENLYSLARTSRLFNEFLQQTYTSTDLIKYFHTIYPLTSRDNLVRLLHFINTDVALHYYKNCGTLFDSGKRETLFSQFLRTENSVSVHKLLLSATQNQKLNDVHLLARLGGSFSFNKKAHEEDPYNNPLKIAISSRNKKLIKLCIYLGKLATDVDCFFDALRIPGYQKITHHCSLSLGEHRRDLIEAFVELGADVNARNRTRRTPLHIATQANNVEIVEFLLSEGASPHSRDILLNSPLDIAYGKLESSRISTLIMLLKYGTKLFYTARYGLYGQATDLQTLLIAEHMCSIISFLQQTLKVALIPSESNELLRMVRPALLSQCTSLLPYAYEGGDKKTQKIIEKLENEASSPLKNSNKEVKFLLYNSYYAFRYAILLYMFVGFISLVSQNI